jgi:hypothetical protein
MKWWGYAHVGGTLQVKRYFDHRDLQEARESDFVERVLPVIDAESRDDAIRQYMDQLP